MRIACDRKEGFKRGPVQSLADQGGNALDRIFQRHHGAVRHDVHRGRGACLDPAISSEQLERSDLPCRFPDQLQPFRRASGKDVAAYPIAPDRSVTGRLAGYQETDFYRLTVDDELATQQLDVTLSSAAGASRRLCLLDGTGAELQCREEDGSPALVGLTLAAAGAAQAVPQILTNLGAVLLSRPAVPCREPR